MHSLASSIGAALTGKDQSKDPSKGDCSKRGRGRRNFRGRGAEAKDQTCSASVAERLGTHQISVGFRGTPSKKSITRRNMTKMLVNFLILVLLHIVILDLMK